MRTLIKLVIVALVVHAAFRIGMSHWTYYEFKDAVHQTAQFAGNSSEDEIRQRVLQLATRMDVPVDEQAISVRLDGLDTFVDAAYVDRILVAPGYRYPWRFNVNVHVFAVRPPQGDGLPPK